MSLISRWLSSAAGERPRRTECLQLLCRQMIYFYESFLVWVHKGFSDKAEAALGVLSGFL